VGRHSTKAPAKMPGRALILSVVAAVAVVGLVASGVFLWVGGYLNPLFASADSGCADSEQLVIVADTSIAPALADIAEDFDAASETCVETAIKPQDSADTAAVLASGGLDADAWVPESSVWIDRTAATAASLGQSPPEVEVGEPIATTPVVFAAPATKAAEIATEPVTWTRLLSGSLPTILPDPEASGASLAGLLALRAHSSPDDPRQFAGAMIELGKSIPASTSAAFGSLAASQQPSVVLTSEAQVAAYNLDEPVETLVAAYPADGTVLLDYPFVRLPAGPDDDDGDAGGPASADTVARGASSRAQLLQAFETAARGGAERLAADGFRSSDGTGALDIPGLAAESPAAAADLDSAAQLEILRAWGVLTLRSRMLAVIDVSGSMEEPAENGLRRIDIFQQAAIGAMEKFSGEVELGVWLFSTARNGDLDYEDVSPIAPLADLAHKQQIAGIIQSLPGRLGGATGLYDTALAAVQRVRESYDPEKVNSVLLITDGKNEDENGIDLDTLLAELAKIDDPAKPVPVIMIGFGPDTDLAAMQRIAQATKGAAYSASKPEDLGTVLVDALSQRTCRPNCG
jgi:Bacterial extracellular solute-binding protein/von Willebrand factor type A domain